jgi:hypothetical protein
MIAFRRKLLGLFLAAGLAGAALAHEIPSEVTAHLIAKPGGDRVQLLVRVPLSAMRDTEFPELASGYLDMEKLAPKLIDLATVWIASFVEIYEGDARLPKPRIAATQISLPSDKSFASFDQALAHINEPLPSSDESLVSDQVLFDVLLEYPIRSDRAVFSMRPGLEHLGARVLTVLRFHTPDGAVRAYQFLGDPGRVPLDPSWVQAAWRFVELGFFHILDGPDHLLFLLCLVIPFRRLRPLIMIVTAFTIAHSMTLIASAFDVAPGAIWFPPLIETLIAITVAYMALENIVGASGVRRRWMFAFGFGLIHGFGFSFALRETLQFAGPHLLTSLISFNIGVELGQILVLLLLVPLLRGLFRFVVAERMGTIILSALVAHTSWHWMTERAELLSQYSFDWTGLTSTELAGATRGLMWIVIAAGLVWMVSAWLRRRAGDAT